MCQDMTNIAPIVRKNHANPVGVGALDDPRAMCQRYAQTVGRGLAPAVRVVRVDRRRKKKACRVRDSEPALRRDEARMRGYDGAQSMSKARRLWKGSNREHSKPKKKDGIAVLFLWCTFRDSNPGPTD